MKPSEILCKKLSFSKEELNRYIGTAPYRYKKYKIPKRTGGWRDIAQPSKDLKVVQRILIEEVLVKKLPVHSSATAYKENSSILKNAEVHLKNSYLLKLDFNNFFPSIVDSDFQNLIIKNNILDIDEATELRLLSRIFFMHKADKLILSIGSPGSPLISNAILYDFDMKVSDMATGEGVSYSRYSDDLTFSSNRKGVLSSWPNLVKSELKAMSWPRLTVNDEKTVFTSKAHNRHVTGITITNDGQASLGRKKKRGLRTKVYLVESGMLSQKEIRSLRGHISYIQSIEPAFVAALWKKYPVGMAQIASKSSY
ncbi:retron St85 family RNA-directed DNA polymerase [Kiloniella sp.]|uniref:retron St85 family RNA-directed DNA polymerase n=1 Tax=Kiloniella sp. TaxID=1938587 RepID=UPI003A9226CE